MTTTLDSLTRDAPAPEDPGSDDVAEALTAAPPTRWVVLDDDPTGTQSVRDLPVLTSWSEDDLRWAFATGHRAVYVQTNARSLDPDAARAVMDEVVTAAAAVAAESGDALEIVSRTDSTLRGHFPLDTDVIAQALTGGDLAASTPDAVLLVPAFPDAGRVTVDGMHYVGSPDGTAVPVADTPFADDATFGFRSSDMREWIAEKTAGTVSAAEVVHLPLTTIRRGAAAVAEVLTTVSRGHYVTADVLVEADMHVIATAVHQRRADGATFLYRVGPPFVRALIAQPAAEPLTLEELGDILGPREPGAAEGGLVVVGSHVPTTTHQLDALRAGGTVKDVEIDVHELLEDDMVAAIEAAVSSAADGLHSGHVVVSTSRDVITGTDEADSLRIARRVSHALVAVTKRVTETARPRFVIAKGGITSSDVATHGLGIRRALVRGPMLPGIVSLWQSIDGPAKRLAYMVFAGNVGDVGSLRDVVDRLTQADTGR